MWQSSYFVSRTVIAIFIQDIDLRLFFRKVVLGGRANITLLRRGGMGISNFSPQLVNYYHVKTLETEEKIHQFTMHLPWPASFK